jgi:hypothetical protein
MMRPDAKVEKVYVYPKHVDFRKFIDGLGRRERDLGRRGVVDAKCCMADYFPFRHSCAR